jgi:hypothetical protein
MPSSVFDLWMEGTQIWDQDILATIFTPQIVQTINNTCQMVRSGQPTGALIPVV